MSDEARRVEQVVAARTTANIRLAGQFLREIVDDPSILDTLPDDAAVVLIPEGDPDLAEANLNLAFKLAKRETRTIQLRRVGGAVPEAERWRKVDRRDFTVRNVSLRWPSDLDPRNLVTVYDRERDVLLLDMTGEGQHGIALPRGSFAAVLADVEAGIAFGYLIPRFISHAIRHSPELALLLAAAELRPLREEELGGLESLDADAHGENIPSPFTAEETARLVDQISLLIA
jgi:hypothetical protein